MAVSDHAVRRWSAASKALRVVLGMIVALPLAIGVVASTPSAAAAAPVVYVTFDDGPDGSVTDRILDTLDIHGAKATFFVVGENVDRHPAVARRILSEGHAIANQSYSHPRLTTLSDAGVRSEFTRASIAISAATGSVPSCYRPPYGAVDARIHRLAVETGLRNSGWTAGSANTHWGLWDIDTRDWELSHNQTWYQLSRVSAGDVVLMHSLNPFSADIATVDVADQRTLDPGGILPVALATPTLIGGLLAVQTRRNHRGRQRTGRSDSERLRPGRSRPTQRPHENSK